MKIYLLSFGAGLLVGVLYSLINIRSPAPPLIALLGLLGILIGEQLLPVGRHMLTGSSFDAAFRQSQCAAHVMGMLPGRHATEVDTSGNSSRDHREH
jgi:XapX domain-containing protein